jgi:hypothetical protein
MALGILFKRSTLDTAELKVPVLISSERTGKMCFHQYCFV